MKKWTFTSLFSLCLIATASLAKLPFSERTDVDRFMNKMHSIYHFKRDKLKKLFDQVEVREDIIERIKKPYEKKPWRDYKKLFVTDSRLKDGLDFWLQHEATLKRAEKKYKVPASVIVAIIGIETKYGRNQGSYKVLNALSTLAFNYPKRAKFFKKELTQFLLLCREQKISPLSVYGSYAGAIGQPQFMPSSYRYYAVDFSGNGKKDLSHNTDDVIGSVANYLKIHGWKYKQPIAEQGANKHRGYRFLDVEAKQAKYTTRRLKNLGIKLKAENLPKRASVIALHSDNDKEYWVGYPNFFVITRYNNSKQYALAAYLLAQNLKSAKIAHAAKSKTTTTHNKS